MFVKHFMVLQVSSHIIEYFKNIICPVFFLINIASFNLLWDIHLTLRETISSFGILISVHWKRHQIYSLLIFHINIVGGRIEYLFCLEAPSFLFDIYLRVRCEGTEVINWVHLCRSGSPQIPSEIMHSILTDSFLN